MALITSGSFGTFSAAVSPSASAISRHPAANKLRTLVALGEATREVQPAPVVFGQSPTPRGLALKSMKLTEGFEGFLQGLWNKNNEIYFVSWAWDLSGEKPYEYPGLGASPGSVIIPMKVGKVREFLGDGVALFPSRMVTGGLAVRIMIWESDQNARDFGKAMIDVSNSIQDSKLTNLLQLIALGTGVTGATVSMVFEASLELAKVIGIILKANSDDYVDLYEGYYSADSDWMPGSEAHAGNSSEVVLTRL